MTFLYFLGPTIANHFGLHYSKGGMIWGPLSNSGNTAPNTKFFHPWTLSPTDCPAANHCQGSARALWHRRRTSRLRLRVKYMGPHTGILVVAITMQIYYVYIHMYIYIFIFIHIYCILYIYMSIRYIIYIYV